jgi:hypothetical protein
MPEDKLQPEQVLFGSPIDDLVTKQQSVPDDTVQVSPGTTILEGGVKPYPFAGGNTGSFAVLPGGMASRWDMVALNLTVTPPVLQIIPGTAFATPQNFEDSIADVPAGRHPLAAVHVTELATVVVLDDDIQDLRALYHQLDGFAPTTAGDWDVPPTETHGALDELASRLTTAVSPADIHVTTASVGTDRDAARADHVHSHSDLSGTVTTHHDSLQVLHTQVTPANWTLGSPASVSAHLEELAAGAGGGGGGDTLVRIIAAAGGTDTSLSAAVAAFEADSAKQGVFFVRGSIASAMAAPDDLTKPIEIVGETDDAELIFNNANDLTLNSPATNERFPITIRHVRLNFTSTGGFVFSGSGYVRMEDGSITGTGDEKFRFGGDDNFAALKRVKCLSSTGNLFGFDDTLVSGTLEAWFDACVCARSFDYVQAVTPAPGGVDCEFHFVNGTMAPFSSFNATGFTVDLYMDGTSWFYTHSGSTGTLNHHGTSYFDPGMNDRYNAIIGAGDFVGEMLDNFYDVGGKHIKLGPGTFTLTGSPAVTASQNNFTLEGAGPGVTILQTADATTPMFNLNGNTDVVIKGLTFECTHVSATTLFILGTGSDRAKISDIQFISALTGAAASSYYINLGNTADDCIIENITTSVAAGGRVGTGIRVGSSCHISNCNLAKTSTGIQAGVTSTPGGSISNCDIEVSIGTGFGMRVSGNGARVSDCRITHVPSGASSGMGIRAEFADECSIANCWVDCGGGAGSLPTGIEVFSSVRSTVIGNRVRNASSASINVPSNNCVVEGNTIFSGTSSWGLRCSAQYCVISNNFIDTNATIGIELLSAANDCTVVGNRINGPSWGIVVSGTATASVIKGNRIDAITNDGIDITSTAGDMVINGNIVDNCGANGIDVTSVINSVVSDNIVFNVTGTAITAAGAGTIIVDNVTH